MTDTILASHILLMYRGSSRSTASRTKEDAQRQIEEIKQQLDAGADFEALAKKYSDCPSASRGGDLGLFGRGQMVPQFDKAAFALAIDEMSDIVETEFGFHIILRMG
jgi:parvulin-like peptidyl-prolyl isomerase